MICKMVLCYIELLAYIFHGKTNTKAYSIHYLTTLSSLNMHATVSGPVCLQSQIAIIIDAVMNNYVFSQNGLNIRDLH